VKELNLAFLPIEERVFSLDNPTAYNDYYGGKMTEKKLEEIAEQLVFLMNKYSNCSGFDSFSPLF
jgi:hypothetical protein